MTRAVLLAAMIEVVGRRGFAQASVENVVECAGLARATFYQHFPSRDQCFVAALNEMLPRLEKKVRVACLRPDESGAVQAALYVLVEFTKREPAAARALFFESLGAGPRGLNVRATLLNRLEAYVAEFEADRPGPRAHFSAPLRCAIGGLARLLAMRLRHQHPDLDDLHAGLAGWLAAYTTGGGEPGQPEFYAGKIEPVMPLPVPVLEPPTGDPSGGAASAAAGRIQRQGILRALARCSYAKGYGEVGLAEVLGEAGVSRKAFYAQFRSKAQAGTEANEETFQAAMTATAAAFFAAQEWPERVWEAGRALLSFISLYPADAYLGFVEPHAVGEETVNHIYDRLGAFTLFLEEGYAYRPEAEALPRLCSELIAAAMFELAACELGDGGGGPKGLLGMLPELAYTILAPFMGPAAAAEFIAGKLAGGGDA